MIQFNLLPDVKLEYVKAQRVKHTVVSAALIAAGSAFVIFLLLFLIVNVVQKKSLSDANDDIKKYQTTLKNTPDLAKILTIQNQLGALPGMHADKVATSRTIQFLGQLTPAAVTVSECAVDYTASTISISGQTTGLDKVNALVDTMKFTTYGTGESTGDKAFSDVVLSQFSKTSDATTFTVTATFVPEIYNNALDARLNIPNTVSTRSVVEQPSDLFKKAPTNDTGTSR